MFNSLTDGLQNALKKFFGPGKMTEGNVAEALAEVKNSLLAADVHFKVAREIVEKVSAGCVGQKVLENVAPGQMVVKLVQDELTAVLGGTLTEIAGEPIADNGLIKPQRGPLRIILCGLQGSGKTTAAAKLAAHLKKSGITSLLVACDLQRPAAIEQLEILATQVGSDFFKLPGATDPVKVAQTAFMSKPGYGAYIFDTAGRLQIDAALMTELKAVAEEVDANEKFLVVDSALGQQAVPVAKSFADTIGLTGLILTKLDGDARGGAALSIRSLTGLPIRFVGVGEKPADFERFYPERMAGRILGMGDVVGLVEKAQENFNAAEAQEMATKAMSADFNLEDLLKQFQSMKKMGDVNKLVQMIPGMSNIQVGNEEQKKMARSEAIILSMTPRERKNPSLVIGSRLSRIAKGSGVPLKDVNAVLKQFHQMRDMMKMMKGSKGKEMMRKMEAMKTAQK